MKKGRMKKLKLKCACGMNGCWVSFKKGEKGEVSVTAKNYLEKRPAFGVILIKEEIEKLKKFLEESE